MDVTTVAALAILFAIGAALYSSVGHGGASAYIAAMALFAVAPETMKPTALALNLLVAGFGAWRYWRRGLRRQRCPTSCGPVEARGRSAARPPVA
jgi:uncharacterized membrane protein YfcA